MVSNQSTARQGAGRATSVEGVAHVDVVPDDEVLSAEQHVTWWREWVEHGPQGPITDDPDDGLPDEP